MYIAVDFDGTICEHVYPSVGKPVPGAIKWMKEWNKYGGQIILWTMRSGDQLQEAVEYLTRNGVMLFGVNSNPTQAEWTLSPKAYAVTYVDDAAWGCPLVIPKGVYTDEYGRTKAIKPFVDWTNLGPDILSMIKTKYKT